MGEEIIWRGALYSPFFPAIYILTFCIFQS